MKNSDLKEFVNKARTYAIENGKEKALAAFNDRNGPFTKGEFYIFAYDYDGYTLALPYEPSFIGSNRLSISPGKLWVLLASARTI